MVRRVALSDFALAALGRDDRGAPVRIELAIVFYLADRDSRRSGWPYPGFLPDAGVPADTAVEIDLEDARWREFEAEAERQGVPVDLLARHAAIYFAAELDAGRVTQRIVDDLEASAVRGAPRERAAHPNQ